MTLRNARCNDKDDWYYYLYIKDCIYYMRNNLQI